MAASTLGLHLCLGHNEPMQEVNDILRQFSRISLALVQVDGAPHPKKRFYLFPQCIAYEHANARRVDFNRYFAANPLNDGGFTAADWNSEANAYGLATDAVAGCGQSYSIFYLANFQNIVFSHSWDFKYYDVPDTPASRARFYQRGDVAWHEFVAVLHQRSVYIYDPSYAPPPPNTLHRRSLASYPLCAAKARILIQYIRKQKGLVCQNFYIGGGGNTEGNCREMSLGWIERIIDEISAVDDSLVFDLATTRPLHWQQSYVDGPWGFGQGEWEKITL